MLAMVMLSSSWGHCFYTLSTGFDVSKAITEPLVFSVAYRLMLNQNADIEIGRFGSKYLGRVTTYKA